MTVRYYVFFSPWQLIHHLPVHERLELHAVAYSWRWESSLLFFSHRNASPTSCSIDTPEVPPGAVLGPSGVTVAASATPHTSSALSTKASKSPSTLPSPTPTGGSSSNTGAIVGGVVGGVVAISIAVVAIVFFLRRQQTQAPPAALPGTGAPQPPIHGYQQPLMDNGMHTASTLTGTPVFPVKLYVRVFVPNQLSRFCVFILCAFLLNFPLRTRVTQLRSLGMMEFHSPRILPKDSSHHKMKLKTLWLPCRPRGHWDITAYLVFDFAIDCNVGGLHG